MAYQWTKTDAAAPERVLLIGLDCGDYDAEASMAELERLTDTAGGLVVGHTVQKRPAPEGATYIGSGLVESLADFCKQNEVDLTVADGSLTPVQARNLERALGTAVIDRTALILDIFAARARSSEGKLQVELAQLQYRLPRLGGRAILCLDWAAVSAPAAPAKASWKATGAIFAAGLLPCSGS